MSVKSKRQAAEYLGVSSQSTGRLSPEKDEIGRVARPRVTYTSREDATLEGELAALAEVCTYVLERHDGRKLCSKTQSGGEGAQNSSSQERVPGKSEKGDRDE